LAIFARGGDFLDPCGRGLRPHRWLFWPTYTSQ
jgi:hypothetical protein